MSIVLTSGDYVGKASSNYIYLIFADALAEYWTEFYQGATLGAKLEKDADGNVEAVFNSSYSGIDYSTIMLAKFAANSFAADYYNGVYQVMYSPVLTRTVAK